jgi:hypothetical protein
MGKKISTKIHEMVFNGLRFSSKTITIVAAIVIAYKIPSIPNS